MKYTFDTDSQTLSELESTIKYLVTEWVDRAVGTDQLFGKVIMYDGSVVDIINFNPEDYNPEHAFNTLPQKNRYDGNSYIPICVGKHSLLCYNIAKFLFPECNETQFLALIHDFTESIMGDCITPIKHLPVMIGFSVIEDRIWKSILKSIKADGVYFLTDYETLKSRVKLVDKIALSLEVRNLNRHADLPVWKPHVFSEQELIDILCLHSENSSCESAIGFHDIERLSERHVELRLRSTYNKLIEKLK
jgi:hypothetical protein